MNTRAKHARAIEYACVYQLKTYDQTVDNVKHGIDYDMLVHGLLKLFLLALVSNNQNGERIVSDANEAKYWLQDDE